MTQDMVLGKREPMTPAKWADFRARMPQLIESEGVWEGWYRYYDAETGKLVDEHRSRLICRIMDEDSEYPYYQTNQYYWEDGRTDFREFPAWYDDGRVWWDNDLITGWAAPMQPDDLHRTTCLNWTRRGESDLYLYEMIQHAANGIDRARTWQWFRNDRCWQRTGRAGPTTARRPTKASPDDQEPDRKPPGSLVRFRQKKSRCGYPRRRLLLCVNSLELGADGHADAAPFA